MKPTRRRSQPGLIYCQTDAWTTQSTSTKSVARHQAGTIRGFTPKRTASTGKIVLRSSQKKTKYASVEIQTDEILSQIQLKIPGGESFQPPKGSRQDQSRIRKPMGENFLKIADHNILFDPKNTNTNKTAKKAPEENQFKAFCDAQPVTQAKSSQFTHQTNKPLQKSSKQNCSQVQTVRKGSRWENISKLSEVYEKNLAKYEAVKGTIGLLLKQNQRK